MTTAFDAQLLDWEKNQGLIPAIVQDADNGRVLMLGYMNAEALAATMKTKKVTFYSRSRKALWQKGETSGHALHLCDMLMDCDGDTLLVLAKPSGPTCHTGTVSCFPNSSQARFLVLADLEKVISSRKGSEQAGSYTASLFASGVPRMAQKVGEEGVEIALAAVTAPQTVPDESADLVYHLLVLLAALDMSFKDVLDVLARRADKAGA